MDAAPLPQAIAEQQPMPRLSHSLRTYVISPRSPFWFQLTSVPPLTPSTAWTRRRRVAVRSAFGALIACSMLVAASGSLGQVGPIVQPPAAGEPEQDVSDLHSLYYSAHLPIDRRLAQDLEQASRLFAAERYSEGLPLIDRVLKSTEDTFELASRRPSLTVASSLKQEAKRQLAALPAAGIAALELDQGVRARRALNAAFANGDLGEVARVARRYPVTEAATEALLALAQAEMDMGRFGSAAAIYRELLSWPKAKSRYGALLTVRIVGCYAAVGDAALLEEAADALRRPMSPAERNDVERLIGTNDIEAWIGQLGRPKDLAASPSTDGGWLIEGRNAARNPLDATGGVPHVWPAWEARTVKEMHVASRLKLRVDWQQRRGMSWGLVASPLAVGNYVIVRTPTNLIAVDWQSGSAYGKLDQT